MDFSSCCSQQALAGEQNLTGTWLTLGYPCCSACLTSCFVIPFLWAKRWQPWVQLLHPLLWPWVGDLLQPKHIKEITVISCLSFWRCHSAEERQNGEGSAGDLGLTSIATIFPPALWMGWSVLRASAHPFTDTCLVSVFRLKASATLCACVEYLVQKRLWSLCPNETLIVVGAHRCKCCRNNNRWNITVIY